MDITVDTREPEHIFLFLKSTFPEHNIIRGMCKSCDDEISAGDYSSEHLLVERKTWIDLWSSVSGPSRRLDSQIDRLSQVSDKIVMFLITGSLKEFVSTMSDIEFTTLKIAFPDTDRDELRQRADQKASRNADTLLEVVASLSCRYAFLIWRVEQDYEGLIEIVKLMTKISEGKWMVPSRRNPDTLIARLLKITPYQWLMMKERFGSLDGVIKANENELQSIWKVGPKRAGEIKRILIEGA